MLYHDLFKYGGGASYKDIERRAAEMRYTCILNFILWASLIFYIEAMRGGQDKRRGRKKGAGGERGEQLEGRGN